MSSLVDVLDNQVLAAHVAYFQEQGRLFWRETWRPGQSWTVIRSLQESSASYYAQARRCREELLRHSASDGVTLP